MVLEPSSQQIIIRFDVIPSQSFICVTKLCIILCVYSSPYWFCRSLLVFIQFFLIPFYFPKLPCLLWYGRTMAFLSIEQEKTWLGRWPGRVLRILLRSLNSSCIHDSYFSLPGQKKKVATRIWVCCERSCLGLETIRWHLYGIGRKFRHSWYTEIIWSDGQVIKTWKIKR